MATQTQHYGLAADVVTDDFVQPDHQNRVAETLDRVVGNVVKQLLTAGVYDGWLIQNDKTVASGEGLIAGCWCSTASAQGIVGLQNDTVNYVFAVANSQSPPAGTVDFSAQQTSTGPTGSLYLGSIELDADGQALAIDNSANTDRYCFPLKTKTVSGSGQVEVVPGGAEVSFTVDHQQLTSFLIPGAIEFEAEGDDFDISLHRTYHKSQFEVVATNQSSYPRDLNYSWQRWGITT